MIDADVVDTDVTAEEWMQLNNIIRRIDSDIDVSPSIKPDTPPASVIYVPLPVSIPITHISRTILQTFLYTTSTIDDSTSDTKVTP